MKRTQPILTAAANAGTGSLSIAEAVDIIRAAGVFDESFYRERYITADPMLNFVDPISHYLLIGFDRGFEPSRAFSAGKVDGQSAGSGGNFVNPLLRLALRGGAKIRTVSERQRAGASGLPKGPGRQEPDFSRLTSPESDTEPPKLSVIMPVYTGYIETLRAIHSVLSSRNATHFEFIVVNDRSPDERLVERLKGLASAGLFSLCSNRRNMGFVRSVNKALKAHPSRDVILLNSDTLVFGDWIDRLLSHADAGVATITPFSNNASLCSYPRIFESSIVPAGTTARSLDRLAARVNRGQSIEVPTGVGFCMYLSRLALRKIGNFDAAVFGQGYGEENDFCLRASKAGFRNLQALDVFVYHKGAVSFGASADGAQKRNHQKLLSMHPDFPARLRKFAVSDPGRRARQRLDLGRLTGGRGKSLTLHVVGASDGLPASIGRQGKRSAENSISVLIKPDPAGRTISLAPVNDRLETPNLRGIALEGKGSLFDGLLNYRSNISVKVHDAAGYDGMLLRRFLDVCKLNGITVRFRTAKK